MNKRIKWGIIILIVAGLAGLGIYYLTPHENEELAAADALPKENKQRALNVNARCGCYVSLHFPDHVHRTGDIQLYFHEPES